MKKICIFLLIIFMFSYTESFGQDLNGYIQKITYNITKVSEFSFGKVMQQDSEYIVALPIREYEQEGTLIIDYKTGRISLSLFQPFGLNILNEVIDEKESSDGSVVILTKSYKIIIEPRVQMGGFQSYIIRFLYNYVEDLDQYLNFLQLNAVTSEKYLSSTQYSVEKNQIIDEKKVKKELTEKEILERYKASSEVYKSNINKSNPVVIGCNKYIQFTTEESWNRDIIFDLDYIDSLRLPISVKVQHYQMIMQFISQHRNQKITEIADSFNDFTNVYITDSEGYNIDLKYYNLYFVGTYDFDNDGIEELIIGVRDEDFDNFEKLWDNSIEINIFKISKSDYSGEAFYFFKKIGNLIGKGISGIPSAIIEDNTIKIPRNLRGFFYGLKYEDGMFKNIDYY